MGKQCFTVLTVFFWAVTVNAEYENIWDDRTLTNGFWGLNDTLTPMGIETAFSVTSIYQRNVKGGRSTSRRTGEFAGSYDLEMTFDLERLLNVGGILYMHGEGGWSRGIDAPAVGSAFGVNFDVIGNRSMDIAEVYYEGSFGDETLRIRVGKLDMRGGFECRGCPVSFDGSMYANDETTQFLNSALVNNPTIPFGPDYALGAILHWNPVEHWYLSFGVSDAEAVRGRTGFDTAFHGDTYFLYIVETGITPQLDSANGPMQGAYRIGVWYDPLPKAHSDAVKDYRDDTGLYVSCDQMFSKENNDPGDTQGLGTFFRYGYVPSRTNDITNFFSTGLQYQGLFGGRDDDVLAIGYAHGVFSDRADTTYTKDYESATELYYNAQMTRWMALSPSVQYVTNPGGGSVSDAVVVGLRALITF